MLKHMLFGAPSESSSWVATLGGSSYDYGKSVSVASDGSIYVCGETYSAGAGDSDLLLAKFNSSGVIQWQKTIGGSDWEYEGFVTVASDGSVYVCGNANSSPSSNSSDLFLAKFNSSGVIQWQKTLSGSNDNIGRSVSVASDGSVYVCGNANSDRSRYNDLFLAKFNSSGVIQWQKTLSGSKSDYSSDYGQSVSVAPDGSVYVCGYTNSAGTGYNDLLLAKFNSSGVIQWQKTLSGRSGSDYSSDYGQSVSVAPDGSVYVCGETDSTGDESRDLLLAKFNSSGVIQWQKTIGGSGSDTGYSVSVAPDGSVYVCGQTNSAGAGYVNLFLAKFNSSGVIQWQKTIGGRSGSDIGRSVSVAPDGSVYVCGQTYSAGAGEWDFLLAKITDSLIGNDTVTFGNFTFQDAALTAKNASLTNTSSSLSVSNARLTLSTPSLTVGTTSLTTNLYKE